MAIAGYSGTKIDFNTGRSAQGPVGEALSQRCRTDENMAE